MAYPRIIPHSDGAGVVDAVGAEVGQDRVGQRVWVYGAQSYRPFGTAAQLTVLPDPQAVAMPAEVSDDVGACLGIPGITAHRAVFSDGPVAGKRGIVEVALSDNADLDAEVVTNNAVIAAYATRAERPTLPFWPLLFANVTLRLLGSDDFSPEAKQQAARDLTTAAAEGALSIHTGDHYPLSAIAEAHDRVDAGGRGRVLVKIPQR